MQEKSLPPTTIAAVIAIVVAVVLVGFFAYRSAQPPAPTGPGGTPIRSGIDPKNPAKPPVADEHANDWHPPAPPAGTAATPSK